MRKSLSLFAGAALICAGGQQVSAQCSSPTSIETVAGRGILGRIENPAYAWHRARANASALQITDGTTISLNTNNVDGLLTRTYEFDIDASGVTPGNVAVPLNSADLGLGIPVFNVRAARALVDTINADPDSPVWSDVYPLGDDQYISHMWKYDGGYGATNAKTGVGNGGINAPGTFAYINNFFRSFVFIHGTDLDMGALPVIKLVKSDDAGVERAGYITRRRADLISVWFGVHQTNTQPPLPDGTYNVVIEQTDCTTVTFESSITIVENLINDGTFNTNLLGNWGSLNWQALNDWLCPVWQNDNPYNDDNPISPGGGHLVVAKKGDLFFPLQANPTRVSNPRQLPLPTGEIETNAWQGNTLGGDNECGSLRFPMASGRREMWQILRTNLVQDTFCTLTGLWTGGTTAPATLTYGVEIRENDKNGTIISQTPPATAIDRFDWYSFEQVVTIPGGPQTIAVVVYGDNSEATDAGVHIDELLLRTGAVLWPDADGDGDVDTTDFAAFQLCLTGADSGPYADESCAVFDRDGDTDIDAADFTQFANCGTGPEVELTPASLPVGCSL